MKPNITLPRILLLFLTLSLSIHTLSAQTWVDSLYATQTFADIPYGTATDFAGNARTLTMDVTVPLGDTPPACGRPLMLLIHGGAWIAGTKADNDVAWLMRDFAERGYVAASINYRLGQFQDESSYYHCNVTYIPGVEWDCLNQTDTLEWGRALFRGIQDAHGALRFLMSESTTYSIDPNNVFVVGSSAGGFIALGVGYMDHPDEYPTGVGAVSDAPAPYAPWYEVRCVQGYGMDTSIASMNLSRPDLGDVEGTLNPTGGPYVIRGVGNFFGGTYKDLFQHNTRSVIPDLYLYHQPNDLIVPYGRDKLLAQYAYCMTFWPASCVYIGNRPWVNGSKIIRDMASARLAASLPAPTVLFDSTLNTADCGTQISNPALTGHGIDNFTLRSGNLATFFSTRIVTSAPPCVVSATAPQPDAQALTLYPQPATGRLHLSSGKPITQVRITTLEGRTLQLWQGFSPSPQVSLDLPALPTGIYLVTAQLQDGSTLSSKCSLMR